MRVLDDTLSAQAQGTAARKTRARSGRAGDSQDLLNIQYLRPAGRGSPEDAGPDRAGRRQSGPAQYPISGGGPGVFGIPPEPTLLNSPNPTPPTRFGM